MPSAEMSSAVAAQLVLVILAGLTGTGECSGFVIQHSIL